MAKTDTQAALAVLKAVGIDTDALVQALLGEAQVTARQSRELRVDVLEGAQKEKYGDVSISKAGSNGRFQTKVVFRKDQLAEVISELQAALDTLS